MPRKPPNRLASVAEAQPVLEGVNGGNGNSTEQPTTSTTATSTLPTLGTIVLDPGHGGEAKLGGSSANNATSVSGVKEKKLTLDFCLILQEELVKAAAKKNKQIKVVLTRTSDINVGIRDRARVAAQNKANLFLCLHFNGLEDKSVRGVETFFRAKSNGNPNLADDKDFAAAVQKSLFDSLKSIDNKARNRGVKPDTDSPIRNLAVMDDESLGNTNRPDKCRSCYVELEFISNPDVDKLLISGPKAIQNRNLVMGNLAQTMVDYLGKM